MNITGNKWVYRVKTRVDGFVKRSKARLVTKDYHQQPRLDYIETFSPVIKPTTIQVIISLTMTNRWCLRQLDVQNAFLHGYLQEHVYMLQTQGFVDTAYPNHV